MFRLGDNVRIYWSRIHTGWPTTRGSIAVLCHLPLLITRAFCSMFPACPHCPWLPAACPLPDLVTGCLLLQSPVSVTSDFLCMCLTYFGYYRSPMHVPHLFRLLEIPCACSLPVSITRDSLCMFMFRLLQIVCACSLPVSVFTDFLCMPLTCFGY